MLTTITAIQFTLSVHNVNNIVEAISNYSQCVALGNCNCDDEREVLEDASIPEMVFVFTFGTMLVNLNNLVFVIQVRDIKNLAERATKNFVSSDVTEKVAV